jgi:capsular exopolysaccharide synthesis family protein
LNNQERLIQQKAQVGGTETSLFGPATENTNLIRSIVRILTRRKRWIVGSIVICAIAAHIVNVSTRRTYQAAATIELNSSEGNGLSELLGQQVPGANNLETDIQTETAILKGDSLALAVIEKLNLESEEPFAVKQQKDPEAGLPLEEAPMRRTRLLAQFRAHLKVQPIETTRLIKVSFESYNPALAARIANAIIDSYKSQYLQSHFTASSETSDWLTKQLSELKADVENSDKKLYTFEAASGLTDSEVSGFQGTTGGGVESHGVEFQKLEALNSALTEAEIARIEKEAIYRLVSHSSEDATLHLGSDALLLESNSSVLNQGGGLSGLQQLQQQKNQLKLEIAGAITTYGANNRHLKELQTQLQAVDDQIQHEMQEITKRASSDYTFAKSKEDLIRARFVQQQAETAKHNEKAVELEVLSQEAASRKKLYEDLYTKLQEANISAGIKATNVTVVDPARTQPSPVRPKRSTNLTLGFLGGLLLGLGVAILIDNLDRTVVSPMEIEELTGWPVIGIIPEFDQGKRGYGYGYGASRAYGAILRRDEKQTTDPAGAQNTAWILQHPDSIAAEAFRALRTAILLSHYGAAPRVILVTSCAPSEGKTTVTTNLAISLAQFKKKVLLIEADMRRPSMKQFFSAPVIGGLSSVLTGSVPFDEAVQRGALIENLDVLRAGPRPPLPSELLGSPAFDELLERLRAAYDFVVIDSPPALLLTDALSIASKTDAAIWVARAGVVTRPQLLRAVQLVERNAVPFTGFVINALRDTGDPYGYGYGYSYKSYSPYAEETSDGQ